MKKVKIKCIFRRKGGQGQKYQTKTYLRFWGQNNEIHYDLVQSLERLDNILELTRLKIQLINIQSLKPKLDMFVHHIQLNDIDRCFVTETWTQHRNELEHKYIKAYLDIAEYEIFTQSRQNRKGRAIVVIHKPHLHVKKLSFKENTAFETVTVKLDITTKSYIFSTIYRTPYSTRQLTIILILQEEFRDHITSLLISSDKILNLETLTFTIINQKTWASSPCREFWTCIKWKTHIHINP